MFGGPGGSVFANSSATIPTQTRAPAPRSRAPMRMLRFIGAPPGSWCSAVAGGGRLRARVALGGHLELDRRVRRRAAGAYRDRLDVEPVTVVDPDHLARQ